MICSSCRRTLLARLSNFSSSSTAHNLIPQTSSRILARSVATVPASQNAPPATPPPSTTSPDSPPKATSSATPGESQPFSNQFFPSTANSKTPPVAPSSPKPTASAPVKLTSSVPGGTAFTNLSYVKQPQKPLLALEDNEYPSWLWELVADPNAPAGSSSLDGGVDVSRMTKKTRAKFERKQAKLMAGLEKPIPIHEQSKDLLSPEEISGQAGSDGAKVFVERRRELTKSMREARRKGIREANFLRSM